MRMWTTTEEKKKASSEDAVVLPATAICTETAIRCTIDASPLIGETTKVEVVEVGRGVMRYMNVIGTETFTTELLLRLTLADRTPLLGSRF